MKFLKIIALLFFLNSCSTKSQNSNIEKIKLIKIYASATSISAMGFFAETVNILYTDRFTNKID